MCRQQDYIVGHSLHIVAPAGTRPVLQPECRHIDWLYVEALLQIARLYFPLLHIGLQTESFQYPHPAWHLVCHQSNEIVSIAEKEVMLYNAEKVNHRF